VESKLADRCAQESMSLQPTITVCIPAYGRPEEYALLLKSLLNQRALPYEILICEDGSPQRTELRSITAQFEAQLNNQRSDAPPVRFIENKENLGYDGNLRRLIELATGQYVFFIGNDDYILPAGISLCHEFLNQHQVLAASRSFARFTTDPLQPIGYSRALPIDTVLHRTSTHAGLIMRIGGFFGGLLFDRQWALTKATNQYDGTLYYQIYLLLEAYAQGQVGYISAPTVAARAGNAPLFGNATAEQQSFTPGRYTAKARAKMWEAILRISQDCEDRHQLPIMQAMRDELGGRMSFHVFEMFVGRSVAELLDLRAELKRLGLFTASMPHALFWINRLLGVHAHWFYALARKLLQR
jgi:hypothetical protein